MDLRGKVVVITGGAGGIGMALAKRFHDEGVASVVIADLYGDRVAAVAAELGARVRGVECDVSSAASVHRLIADVLSRDGAVDLYCSNAGVGSASDINAPIDVWQRAWDVNVMATVYACQALLPVWKKRQEGALLVTASAAGLLASLGDAAYTVTKHAAVGLAEWLAMTYGAAGLRVWCLCPQGVRTPMVFGEEAVGTLAAAQVRRFGVIEPGAVADAVIEGLRSDRFFIFPHPELADYYRGKANDEDRWLRAMQRLQAQLEADIRAT